MLMSDAESEYFEDELNAPHLGLQGSVSCNHAGNGSMPRAIFNPSQPRYTPQDAGTLRKGPVYNANSDAGYPQNDLGDVEQARCATTSHFDFWRPGTTASISRVDRSTVFERNGDMTNQDSHVNVG